MIKLIYAEVASLLGVTGEIADDADLVNEGLLCLDLLLQGQLRHQNLMLGLDEFV